MSMPAADGNDCKSSFRKRTLRIHRSLSAKEPYKYNLLLPQKISTRTPHSLRKGLRSYQLETAAFAERALKMHCSLSFNEHYRCMALVLQKSPAHEHTGSRWMQIIFLPTHTHRSLSAQEPYKCIAHSFNENALRNHRSLVVAALEGHLSAKDPYTYTNLFPQKSPSNTPPKCPTGWRRLIGCPKLQIIFLKRATKYRSLLREMTYQDKGSYESSPPCRHTPLSFRKWLRNKPAGGGSGCGSSLSLRALHIYCSLFANEPFKYTTLFSQKSPARSIPAGGSSGSDCRVSFVFVLCNKTRGFGWWNFSKVSFTVTATHCNTLQHTTTRCNMVQQSLQHTATHCNTVQHGATRLEGSAGRYSQTSALQPIDTKCCSVLQWLCCSVLQWLLHPLLYGFL